MLCLLFTWGKIIRYYFCRSCKILPNLQNLQIHHKAIHETGLFLNGKLILPTGQAWVQDVYWTFLTWLNKVSLLIYDWIIDICIFQKYLNIFFNYYLPWDNRYMSSWNYGSHCQVCVNLKIQNFLLSRRETRGLLCFSWNPKLIKFVLDIWTLYDENWEFPWITDAPR